MKPKKSSFSVPQNKAADGSVRHISVPDDRIGFDEPLDEAHAPEEKASEADALAEGESLSGHRLQKIEPDDEHNAENLIQEGMQGQMHGSLTKPRKA